MGKFFNERVQHLKKIPVSKAMEGMRKEYNTEQVAPEVVPEKSERQAMLDRLAKAREVARQNREARNA